ncbi:unnamed protein product [Diamesa tonsa]
MSSAEVNLIANEAEWAKKEEEYQKQILNLKKLNEKLIVYNDDKSKKHESDMQKLQNDMKLVQQRLAKFELDELKGLEGNTSNNMKAFKEKYEGVLRKAQDLLFERQKTINSLELKMEAMNIQIESLREVVSLTKDMLNIRELENMDLTSRFSSMDAKFAVERNRKNLMEKKIELSDKLYGDLKTEYMAQREIFKNLKVQYQGRVDNLEQELKDCKLKEPSTSS